MSLDFSYVIFLVKNVSKCKADGYTMVGTGWDRQLKRAVAVLLEHERGEIALNVFAHERREDVELHLRVEHRVVAKL
jgi:hypothetical protein